MMKWAGLLFLVLLLLSRPVSAQPQGAVEFGVDVGASVSFVDDSDNLTSVHLPIQNLRIGFMAENSFKVEANVGFESVSGPGSGDGQTSLLVGLDFEALIPGGDRSTYILEVGGLYQHVSWELYSFDRGQLGLKGGVGLLLPTTVDKLYVRPFAHVARFFESSNATERLLGQTVLSAGVGLSFFTK